MKNVFGLIVLFCVFTMAPLSLAAELTIVHTDPEWEDGKGDVPGKGICHKHGGKGYTPALEISGIPNNALTLRLLFTDDDYGEEGGHGDFILKLNGEIDIKIPSFKDGSLPSNMTGGNGHMCMSCFESDYLGPCSGGKSHTYRVNIYARDSEKSVLAKGTILLGNF